MIALSASALARAEKCPASASLPRVERLHADAEAGTEAHRELAAETPEGEKAEVAYAFNPETGRARLLGYGLERDYPVDWNKEIPGTADRVRVEDGRVVVTDHKTGFGYMVAPARHNLQLAHNAVCAADVAGVDAARVVISRTATDKEDVADLDAFDLAAARERIRSVWRAVNAEHPKVVAGEHCWRCECIARCPAYVELACAVSGDLLPSVIPSEGLTAERVARGWANLKALGRLMGEAKRAYLGFAQLWPVPLGDGKILGERLREREELDGRIARQVLRDLHGEAVADAAVSTETSKAALERAIGAVAPRGAKAGMVRNALAAIASANGIVTKKTMVVDEYSTGE